MFYKNIFVLTSVFILLISNQSEAYLDPGTGSMFLQVVLASIAAIALWIKMSWQSIKFFFRTLLKGKCNNKEDG